MYNQPPPPVSQPPPGMLTNPGALLVRPPSIGTLPSGLSQSSLLCAPPAAVTNMAPLLHLGPGYSHSIHQAPPPQLQGSGLYALPHTLVSAPTSLPTYLTGTQSVVSAPTLQFNIPPPSHYPCVSVPTSYIPGKINWPATYPTQPYQQQFQQVLPPALPGYGYTAQSYTHQEPSIREISQSRDRSPMRHRSPMRDRSPIRRDEMRREEIYRDEKQRWDEEDRYRREESRYRQGPPEKDSARSKLGREDRVSTERRSLDRFSRSREARISLDSRSKEKSRELKRSFEHKKQKEEFERENARLSRESQRKENIPSSYKKSSKETNDTSSSSTRTGDRDSRPRTGRTDNFPTEPEKIGKVRKRRDRSSSARSKPILPSKVKIETEDPVDTNNMTHEQIIAMEKKVWIRSTPADLYYERDRSNPVVMRSTKKSRAMHQLFEENLLRVGPEARNQFAVREPPKAVGARHCHDDSSSDSSDSEDEPDQKFRADAMDWMEFRSKDPNRLHPDIWQNMPNEMNDGPACRCPKKARSSGIRHKYWVGETELNPLDPETNNHAELFHYRVTISPPTNFLINRPTTIYHDEHEFIFEGFSMFTRKRIPNLPVCQIIRFNIEYSILFFEEKIPENFTIRELELFQKYFFHELLELWDWDTDQRYFFMPRFVRNLSENGKEVLSMNEVLSYLLNSYTSIANTEDLDFITKLKNEDWQVFADQIKGMLVNCPGMKPSTIRVDQLDRDHEDKDKPCFPDIVHFGLKPPQLCYAGNPEYQKLYREFVKFRHLLANMPKPTMLDKESLESKEMALQEMRSNVKMKRDTTVVVSSKGFYKTGLMTDIVQHALLLPVLVSHLRFHFSLDYLETKINYKFNNRFLLQQALTHPSYKENFGTNPDHVRNTLSNCGIRQPEYGDKKVHVQSARKRGINVLINIMSRFGKKIETESAVKHNERLEFLGDAVVEFITSVHLFYMFPDLEEGGLATYRSAIVLNQNLSLLALALDLEKYILFSHGSDLCHDSELKHAMANCFEAFMGAVFLDGGINVADKVFSTAMFSTEPDLFETWTDIPHHPLQTQEPGGDRHWIDTYPNLQKLVKFENETGIEFTHIRLLARAFTDRSIGFNNLTLGSNQRLEFLGDTVLQLVTSEFLYKHFPDHHEGHLSLLRASLVNNRTQSVVCDDLGMTRYASFHIPKVEFKVKDKADLLEAFVGALYVDKDLYHCQVFAEVCFFPRLRQFILNQDWNDPKSKLQQCCLTLRTMDGGEPDIPVYKVIECKGPSNTRIYTVAVYFRGERLAKSTGHSIQMAEMNAAKNALDECSHLFPHLSYQKRILERSFKQQGFDFVRHNWLQETNIKREELGMNVKEEKLEENLNINSQADNQEQGENLVSPKNSTGTDKACTKRSDDKEKDKGSSKKEAHAATTRKEEATAVSVKKEKGRVISPKSKNVQTESVRKEKVRGEISSRDPGRNDRKGKSDVSVRKKETPRSSVRESERRSKSSRRDELRIPSYRRDEERISSELRDERRSTSSRRSERRDSSAGKDQRRNLSERIDYRRDSNARKDQSRDLGARKDQVRDSSARRYHERDSSARKDYERDSSTRRIQSYDSSSRRDQDRDPSGKRDQDRDPSGKRDQDRDSNGKRDQDRDPSGKIDQGRDTSTRRDSRAGKVRDSRINTDEFCRSEDKSSPEKCKRESRKPIKERISAKKSELTKVKDNVRVAERKSESDRSQDKRRTSREGREKNSESEKNLKPESDTLKSSETSRKRTEERSKDLDRKKTEIEELVPKSQTRNDGEKSKIPLSRVNQEIQEIENKLAKKKHREEKKKEISTAVEKSLLTSEEIRETKDTNKRQANSSSKAPINCSSLPAEIISQSPSKETNLNLISSLEAQRETNGSDAGKVIISPKTEAKSIAEKRIETTISKPLEISKPSTSEVLSQHTPPKPAAAEDTDIEEGECSDDDDDDLEPVKPEEIPIVPEPKPEPIRIEKSGRKSEANRSPDKLPKERKPEKTEKEKEREEKKKRWRKESPKRRQSRTSGGEGSRARSPGPYRRSLRRSPSPRDRDRSKRSRMDYDRYDRYPDYPSRSPNPYWSPEYYDRQPRSPSRDRQKSKYYDPSSKHYKY